MGTEYQKHGRKIKETQRGKMCSMEGKERGWKGMEGKASEENRSEGKKNGAKRWKEE